MRALAAAAVGITQASDAWDTVSDSFCDEDGRSADETGYANGKVPRDAAAWEHVETFLAHGARGSRRSTGRRDRGRLRRRAGQR
ncbi:hypothetical protein [Streptomyces sp. NPDC059479]|uniref:hypothetical protein n=1 Tax=Streptomyces sp. NPDC059479 TaxID=3346848 RepID=UPI0036B0FEFA